MPGLGSYKPWDFSRQSWPENRYQGILQGILQGRVRASFRSQWLRARFGWPGPAGPKGTKVQHPRQGKTEENRETISLQHIVGKALFGRLPSYRKGEPRTVQNR